MRVHLFDDVIAPVGGFVLAVLSVAAMAASCGGVVGIAVWVARWVLS